MLLKILIFFAIFECEVSGIKFPGRRESILGETYFASEQLLNTGIDDVKPFIADFTLPETTRVDLTEGSGDTDDVIESDLGTGIEVIGTVYQVTAALKEYERRGVAYTQLVIRLQAEEFIYVSLLSQYTNDYEMGTLDLTTLNMTTLEELWIVATDPGLLVSYSLHLDVHVRDQQFVNFKRLHVLCLTCDGDSTFRVDFPSEFIKTIAQLHVLDVGHAHVRVCRSPQCQPGCLQSFLSYVSSEQLSVQLQVIAWNNYRWLDLEPDDNETFDNCDIEFTPLT